MLTQWPNRCVYVVKDIDNTYICSIIAIAEHDNPLKCRNEFVNYVHNSIPTAKIIDNKIILSEDDFVLFKLKFIE